MFNFIKNLFSKSDNKKPKHYKVAGSNDPYLEAVLNECLNTGKAVEGRVDAKGNLTMKTIEN